MTIGDPDSQYRLVKARAESRRPNPNHAVVRSKSLRCRNVGMKLCTFSDSIKPYSLFERIDFARVSERVIHFQT